MVQLVNKYHRLLICTLILIILGYTIYRINKYQERSFVKMSFTNSNYINNKTELKYLDTILYVTLDYFKLSGLSVTISNIPKITNSSLGENYDLNGYIKGENLQYVIYIAKMNKYDCIKTIIHEVIHLQQYHSNNLQVFGNTVIWKYEIYNLQNTKYEDRPWEKEAVSYTLIAYPNIYKILYKQ